MLKVYLSPTKRHAVLSRHGFCRFLGLDKFFAPILALSMPILNGKTTLKNPFTHAKRAMQAGFSLLEMLVVIGLLGILAMGTTTLLIDDGDWKRQDETEKKWDAIRKAIIGEPNLSLNGSPYVAGYVADMGRLPLSISELIESNVTFDNDNNPNTPEVACQFDHDNNAGTAEIPINQPVFSDIPIPDYIPAAGYTNTVSGGWRGPYLYTAGSSFYGDGWYNQNTGNPCDFDWNIITTPANPANLTDIDALRIQSLGSDRNIGGGDTAQDYPANNLNMVNLNEWTLGAKPITFNINFNRPVNDGAGGVLPDDIPAELPIPAANSPHQLQLKIYRYTDNGDNVADGNDIDETVATSTFQMIDGITQAPAQTIDLSGLPIGRFAAVIWCTGNDNTPVAPALPDYTNDVVYDGDCNETTGGNAGVINHNPVYFTVTHNTNQVTLTWNLP